MRKIFNIYGQDAHEMTKKLLDASEAYKLVPSGGDVALKPNLVVAGTPERGGFLTEKLSRRVEICRVFLLRCLAKETQ